MARPQTELNIGQVTLSPTVQGAGKNQVFVAPLPRQNSAQMLAKNLAQFSTVLGQFSNIQARRGEEKALQLTDQEVIDQVESNLPEGFNPFNKISFDKSFSEKRYDRYYDLKIKNDIAELSNIINRSGPDRIGDKANLQDVITEGLGKIDDAALEYVGDNTHMLKRHKEVMGQVSAGLRFSENSKFEKGQVDWLKANSVETFDSNVAEGVQQGMLAAPKGARKPLLDGWISTFYGLESIDKVTADDQAKADRGVPGYEGFSQTVGSSGRKLVPGYSVASNYFPEGTLLNVTFEGEDKPSIYRVDDIGGMDTDKKIDFFAGEDLKLKEKFRLGKIKDVEYADIKASSTTNSMAQILQNIVTEGDADLYDSFHHDPSKRVELLRAGVISAALVEREKGNIDKSDAILEALPNLLIGEKQKLFGSITGQASYEDALEKAEAIDEKNIVANSKYFDEAVDAKVQLTTTAIAEERATKINEEIILPSDDEFLTGFLWSEKPSYLDDANAPLDPIENIYNTDIEKLETELKLAKEKGDTSQITIYGKSLEKLLENRETYLDTLGIRTDSLLKRTNSMITFKASKDKKLGEIANEVSKIEGTEDVYWQEDPTTGVKSVTDSFLNELEVIVAAEQNDFYASSLRTINSLKTFNPVTQDAKLLNVANDLIQENSNNAIDKIRQAWDDEIKKKFGDPDQATPSVDTQFEKAKLRAKQGGLTEEQATALSLATTLKGDETFNVVDEPGKPVEIDVSKPSKGLFNIGNYEEEDLEEYNLLFKNTKATGAFKGNSKAVSEFYENRKTILKEGDFFEPLIDKYNKYVNPEPYNYKIGKFSTGSDKLTELEFQTTRLAIEKRLLTNGVAAEDALQGNILRYPLKKLIQRHWDQMPIISLDTPEDVITDIWNKNGLGEEHEIINRAGLKDIQKVTLEEFIEAQRKLIKDQTK